jgi:hypothetical protein
MDCSELLCTAPHSTEKSLAERFRHTMSTASLSNLSKELMYAIYTANACLFCEILDAVMVYPIRVRIREIERENKKENTSVRDKWCTVYRIVRWSDLS